MIARTVFKNLKGLSSIDVRLGRLTVFVGPNAVGKTTILEGLLLLGELVWTAKKSSFDDVQGVLQGRYSASKLIRAGEKEASLAAVVPASRLPSFVQQDDQTEWVLRADDKDPILSVRWEGQSFDFPKSKNIVEITTINAREEAQRKFERSFRGLSLWGPEVFRYFSGITQLRFEPSRLVPPATLEQGVATLNPDGSNLAAYLQYLHGLRDGALERIEEQVARVVPRFRRLRFKPAVVEREETEILKVNDQALNRKVLRQYPGVELIFEFNDGAQVSAEHASEGTLLTLGLFSAAFAPEQQGMLLIDDLDRALHPAAQARVIAAIRTALDATPDLQIVATTHSPDLIDACTPDEVRVMGFDDKGIPRLADLNKHPEATRWAKLMRTGEFWGSVGEDWVAQLPVSEELPAQDSPEEASEEGERG